MIRRVSHSAVVNATTEAEKRKAMRHALSLVAVFGGSDAGSSLARETPVLEDHEVKEYASWDAYAILIDKYMRWLR